MGYIRDTPNLQIVYCMHSSVFTLEYYIFSGTMIVSHVRQDNFAVGHDLVKWTFIAKLVLIVLVPDCKKNEKD